MLVVKSAAPNIVSKTRETKEVESRLDELVVHGFLLSGPKTVL